MNRIKELRLRNGYAQTTLGDKIGVSKQAIYNYENGYSNPSARVQRALSDVFHVSIDYLMGKTDIKISDDARKAYLEGVRAVQTEYNLIPYGRDTIKLPDGWYRPDMFCIKQEKSSMVPTIADGDLMVFQESKEIRHGNIGAFKMGNKTYCGRYQEINGLKFIQFDNPSFEPIKLEQYELLGILKVKICKL